MNRLAFTLAALLGLVAVAEPDVAAQLQLGPVLARAQRGATAYLALTSGGVAVVDLSDATHPKLVGRLLGDKLVSRLFLDGDALVALEVREEAHRFSLAEPLHPAPAALSLAPSAAAPATVVSATAEPVAPVSPAPARTAQAKVVEVKGGRVIIDGGALDGFDKGVRVRVVSQQLVQKPDLASGGTVASPSGEVTAVLAIEQAQGHRAMAILGRGDVAAPGDLVEPTAEPLSERLALPRRAPFAMRTGFHLRPFLGLEAQSKPVGLLADAYFAYYLPTVPLVLEVSADPLGVAFNSKDRHYPSTFAATAAYSTDYFEIGLGAGALVGNKGPCFAGVACENNTGFTVNQTLRLGALDGLHLEWRSSIFSRPDAFVFGVGRGELAVPLTSRLGLFGGGGAGENGWGFGELGVRTYVGGAGAPGTIVLSASLGYAAVFDGPSYEHVGGPSVAFGAEWRL